MMPRWLWFFLIYPPRVLVRVCGPLWSLGSLEKKDLASFSAFGKFYNKRYHGVVIPSHLIPRRKVRQGVEGACIYA